MKLNRRDFLKGLGLTLTTIPFLRKLPEPPTPEPEPESISLQEEYNERVEQEINNPLYLLAADPAWGNESCSFMWLPTAHDPYAYLHNPDMGGLCKQYCQAVEQHIGWGTERLYEELLDHLDSVDSDRYDVSATGWWTRFRRTPSGRWVGFTPYGYRVLESPGRPET